MRIFLLALLACPAFPHAQPLFLISGNNKVGYINELGKIVLPPVYLSGSDFSEGLAAVRVNGSYGYIDQKGHFIIEPQFEWAEPYANGLAMVYKQGHFYYIDHEGHSPFACNYRSISSFRHGLAQVTGSSKKVGLINPRGQLIVDTLYNFIRDFKCGAALLLRSYKKNKEEWGVVDTLGHMIVPLGKYENVADFSGGYAIVTVKENVQGVIDTKGKLVFSRPKKNNIELASEAFGNGIAVINLYKYWLPDENGVSYTTEKSYPGFIDLQNKIILDDTTMEKIIPFSNGRSFIKKRGENFRMIDTRLQPVGTQAFSDVKENGFVNGYAIVQMDDQWGILDTNAIFVVIPEYERIRDMDRAGFVNGLFKVIIDSSLAFLDIRGKIIWQNELRSPTLTGLNVDFMMRGYFYAYSTPEKTSDGELNGSGGWAVSANIPKKLSNRRFENDSLSVSIDTESVDTFARSFTGYPVYIANTTKDTCRFNAQDSRLYMKMQAQDEHGVWQDIDYLPSSWCGNSYHIIALEPGACWKFCIPRFEGSISTKLRIALQYIDRADPKNKRTLYSNTIAGSINPAQFWNKRQYSPQGIMDPYFD